MVFEQNELEEVPGLKIQDRRKVDREVMIVEGLMHNLVKDGMSVSEINRLLHRAPCTLRTAAYHLEYGKRVDDASTTNERQQIQVTTGVSGVSILFDLYKLYGFDPVKDMAIDRMHMCFNMLKREFLEKLWRDLGDNSEKDGGLLNRDEFGKSLNAVEWTTEDKAAGVARLKSLSDKLGGWKSSEYKRFSGVAKEVLAEKIPSKAYDSYVILYDAVQMLYNKELQINGSKEEHIQRLMQSSQRNFMDCHFVLRI
ncbi:hypothetical protein AC249_AIPGENE27711 [Exaiptasia diaphana]|nr:hypothetical protein AC249_AIPGENE27711 [Exaiptasia diaphana]